MEDARYVVRLEGHRGSAFKHFSTRADARRYADEQTRSGEIDCALIYKVSVSGPEAAIAAVQRGEAELVDVRRPTASQEEIEREKQRDLKIALGRGPKAVLKFLGLSTPTAPEKLKRRV
jgi:hypothetical protein